MSFALVGIASTIAYVLLYLLFRNAMSAQAANVLSLLVTAVANTAANRRLTFGISGRLHAARHQLKGLIAFGIGLALTSGGAGRPAYIQPRPRGLGPRRREPGRHRHQVRAVPDLGLRRISTYL